MTQPVGIERVLAEHQIRDVCYRYARGSDRVDPDLFTSAFWEDGGYDGPHADTPIAQVAAGSAAFMGKHFSATHHLNGNILIDFIDEDNARTEVYFLGMHVTKDDLGPDELLALIGHGLLSQCDHQPGHSYEIVVGGRYLDHFARRGGIWKIRNRSIIFDYCTARLSAAVSVGEGMTAFGTTRMARDRGDPSYR